MGDEEHAAQYDYEVARRDGEQEARRKYDFHGGWCSEFYEAKFVPLAKAAIMVTGEPFSWNDEHVTEYIKALPNMGECQNPHVKEWKHILKNWGPDAVVDKLMEHLNGMRNDWWVDVVEAFQCEKFEPYRDHVQFDVQFNDDYWEYLCCDNLDFLAEDNDDSDCGSLLCSGEYDQLLQHCVPVSGGKPRD